MIDQFFGEKTYAQHGDDLMALNIFKLIGLEKPTYLDIGAHHPFNISNTALLYERGSKGVCVEANPNLIQSFQAARPMDIILNLGVAGTNSVMNFYMIDSHSGRNTFSQKEALKFIGEHPQFKITEKKQIEVVTINHIVERYCYGGYPDFLSIDAEGMDEEIIMSADFSKVRPKVICVETRPENSASIKHQLKKFDFFPYCRMISNLFFVEEKFRERLY